MSRKRATGRYFTAGNPFEHRAFRQWATAADLARKPILEPFAGANSLIHRLQEMDLCASFRSCDIVPAHPEVSRRDTLDRFPRGYEVCVTNPPWLARNSASARGLAFPSCPFDDLYKFALDRCLKHCLWVAALVPESFIRSGQFRDRLRAFVSLPGPMFLETGHPVGLALFGPDQTKDAVVWSGRRRIGRLTELEANRPRPRTGGPVVRFNATAGNVGLIALDNTRTASIRFCEVNELADYTVKHSGRHITKLSVEGRVRIPAWNSFLHDFRNNTQDVLMTCYKGIRRDGKYRRRCDWSLARGIIHHA